MLQIQKLIRNNYIILLKSRLNTWEVMWSIKSESNNEKIKDIIRWNAALIEQEIKAMDR